MANNNNKKIDNYPFFENNTIVDNGNKVRDRLIAIMAIMFSLFNFQQAYFGIWEAYLNRGIHVCVALMLIFLIYPLKVKNNSNKTVQLILSIVDYILIFLSIFIGIYIILYYKNLQLLRGEASTFHIVLALIFISLVFEATRRTIGYSLVIISLILLLYTIFGRYFPYPFLHSGFSLSEVADFGFLSTEGILGIPVGSVIQYVFVFIIFAAFITEAGIADFFKDFSNALIGSTIGGAAKVSVVASGLVGSISGSAAVNVLTTGAFTIPTMKKLGYSPEDAAAIEAAASTGGQIMPPIMSEAAFILAAFTGIPYLKVIQGSLIPAILYFFAVGISVHLISTKYSILGLEKGTLPDLKEVILNRGLLLIPIIVLIVLLVFGYSPMMVGFYATLSTIIISYFVKNARKITVKVALKALEDAGKNILTLLITCACAGIVLTTIIMSGLGMKMAWIISFFAGGNMIMSLIFVAIAAIILGTGLTTTATYIISATLLAPALLQYNIPTLALHLFLLYFSIVNNVTPPLAIAAFTAASLSGGHIWKTCMKAFKLSLPMFILPFFFIYNPQLLMEGDIFSIFVTVIFAILSIIGLSIANEGYLLYPSQRINMPERVVFFSLSILSVFPVLPIRLFVILLSSFLIFNKIIKKKKYLLVD